MTHELDSQGEWQRLYERYHAMSDGELLELARSIGDLTELAANVLHREMKDRRLQIASVPAIPAKPAKWWTPGADATPAPGFDTLTTFHDAIDAGRACEFLEEDGVVFEIRDVSKPQTGIGYDSPPVALELVVSRLDREHAMTVLREKMGPFPMREVDAEDEPLDDGAIAALGYFARREDAKWIAQALDHARIWHRIAPNPEGTEEDEDRFTLEVREIDLTRAGELAERQMQPPED